MDDAQKTDLYEVWSDTVSLKDMFLSIGISLVLGLGGYLIAPGAPPQPLIFGLVGALIAFVISSIIFKQKRELNIREEEE